MTRFGNPRPAESPAGSSAGSSARSSAVPPQNVQHETEMNGHNEAQANQDGSAEFTPVLAKHTVNTDTTITTTSTMNGITTVTTDRKVIVRNFNSIILVPTPTTGVEQTAEQSSANAAMPAAPNTGGVAVPPQAEN
ncbi:hypothetical protein SPI_03717 [Niveomyces insectorum RCEF 264]|uniref:Uncharacterized protein n=1 Tax=Niveomyces insectorum RCEF 264 TaxID=1081102 RepID=A0A167WAT0_9HYPO|nr:hypothetical protein SPI_03717 [Niveomyces insectorum RCEF 264]